MTLILWLLSEIFKELSKISNLDKIKLLFFFSEANLVFDDAHKAFFDRIKYVERLICSKGVAVYLIT